MAIVWLPEDEISFPHPDGIHNTDGIVAVGGDLSVDRLMLAYRWGIFPWFNEDEPPIWWSPDPRCVLFPKDIRVHKSMRSYFNQQKYQVTYDTQFERVMRECKQKVRKGQEGETWISQDFIDAYVRLHKIGIAHSVEVWDGEQLVGGLYGVSLGKCFFGESMFANAPNASKFGFITLVRELEKLGFWLIDAQVVSQHMLTLGATTIPRAAFLQYMRKNNAEKTYQGDWNLLINGISKEIT
ncbi:MAG TPA: leucyl/phenylalanyl-tRNA--protein transferase [Saprospiraceae bacterium]|nr:leucyl/phenylalanyl-tRNA--protein transferase [Saprospiraceae bacterium]